MLQGPKKTIERARKLRKEMSLPEILLWQALRKRPGGLKFRKQHPAGAFVADFFCHEARLVVEVDGEAHDRGDRPERDVIRNRWFAERRFEVMRIPAREVLGDLSAVVTGIAARVEALIPLHHASHGPPPPGGEEL
jgi:very-short-patch-repair endonuclease